MSTTVDSGPRTVYWHRELPPFEAEPMAEHTVEATSGRVPDTVIHRHELWDGCRMELTACADARLEQEVARPVDTMRTFSTRRSRLSRFWATIRAPERALMHT